MVAIIFSEVLPKVEDVIGRPLSPYAITKYVNELTAQQPATSNLLPTMTTPQP